MASKNPSIPIRNSETFQFSSKIVGDDFKILVQLPKSYGTSDQTYPVFYFTDGDDAFELMSGILNVLRIEQHAPEMILVGIGYGADVLDPVNNHRLRDYTPTHASNFQSKEMAGGGAAKFLGFIGMNSFHLLRSIIGRPLAIEDIQAVR